MCTCIATILISLRCGIKPYIQYRRPAVPFINEIIPKPQVTKCLFESIYQTNYKLDIPVVKLIKV